jgi:hypothetical protein
MKVNAVPPPGVKEYTILITPAIAAALLYRNTINRTLRSTKYRRILSDMQAYRFVFTGETIIFNDQYLLNGQHRLLACVESGIPFWATCVEGVATDAMKNMDRVASRSIGDTLGFMGVGNRNDAGAVVRRLVALMNGYNLRDVSSVNKATDAELADAYIELADDIQWGVTLGQRCHSAIGQPTSQWATAFVWLTLNGADPDNVADFASALVEGVGLDAGSPVLALRSWVTKAIASRRELRKDELLIAALKAYRALESGAVVKLLRVSPTDAVPQLAA